MVCSGRGQEGQVDTDWSCIPPRECVCPFSWGGGVEFSLFSFLALFSLGSMQLVNNTYVQDVCLIARHIHMCMCIL